MENSVNIWTELYDIKRQNTDWEIKLENHRNIQTFNHKVDDSDTNINTFQITLSPNQNIINNNSVNNNNNNNNNNMIIKNLLSVNTNANHMNRNELALSPPNSLLMNSGFNQLSDGIKNVEQFVERRKINGITWYYCKFGHGCNYGSNKSNHLVRHVRTHTGEKPYSCDWPNCGKKFTDSWKRKDHILSHNRKMMSFNQTMPSNDNNLKLFVEMLNTNNNICEPIDNELEIKQLEYRPELRPDQEWDDLNRDQVMDNDLNMFIPEVIVDEMDCSVDNILNNNTQTPDETTKAVDPFIERTIKDDKVWYRCRWSEQCNYGSANNHHVVRHIRNGHQNVKPFGCEWPDCAKRFSDAYKLKEHQLTHYRKVITTVGNHNKSSMNLVFDLNNRSDHKIDNRIIISECNNSSTQSTANGLMNGPFAQNNSFNSMTFNVSDVKEQSAQLFSPNRAVMSIKDVEQYVDRRKIEGITRFFCKWPDCSYASNKSNHLVRHIRTHTSDRPFCCSFVGCGKKFTDLWKLTDHQICHNVNKSPLDSSSVPAQTQNDMALVPVLNDNSLSGAPPLADNSTALVPAAPERQPMNYTPNRLLIESLCSPIPLLPTLPLPLNYEKMNVKPRSPADVVMSIRNVEEYVERRKVNGITFYFCKWPECSYGSNKSNHLVRHVRSHTGERPYKCNECDKKFTDSWKLKDHKSIHAKRQMERSMNEQKLALISYYQNLTQNELQISVNEKPIECEINDNNNDIYSEEQAVNQQMEDNLEDMQEMDLLVPQVIIDESDETAVNLNSNESIERKAIVLNSKTEDSNAGVLSIKNVEEYVDKVVRSDGNWYACKWDECGFSTQKSSYIVQHIYKHLGQKPYKCHWNDCTAKFNKKQNLTIHMMSHTGDKPFKCHYPNCYYMAISSDALKLHFQKHSGDKPFRCGWDKCGAMFATGIELLRHTKTHTGVRLHKCHFPNCPYVSKYRNKLTIHLRRHTNDRPFKCTFDNCGKSFIVKDKLKRHEASVHKLQIQQSIQLQQFTQTIDLNSQPLVEN